MKLTTQDAAQYFNLMWSLQAYVNQKFAIISEVDSVEEYEKLSSTEKLMVRDVLYDNIELVDAFLKEAAQKISAEEREIIMGWKEFQRGDFFIERLLKKYAIFIGGEKVYGVYALYEAFDEMLPYVRWPYYTKAVLLPFKGKIIYDGILRGYSVSFGGGIRSGLKETYMAAKQNGRIIESFDARKEAERKQESKQPAKDSGPTLDEIAKRAKTLRSSSGAPAIHSPAFSMAKTSIEFAKLAVENPEDVDELWRVLEKVERAIRKAETVLHRAEYY